MNKIHPLNPQTPTNEVVHPSEEWASSFNSSTISYFSVWEESDTPVQIDHSYQKQQNERSSPEKEKEEQFRQDLVF